jgi:hypothetical protein
VRSNFHKQRSTLYSNSYIQLFTSHSYSELTKSSRCSDAVPFQPTNQRQQTLQLVKFYQVRCSVLLLCASTTFTRATTMQEADRPYDTSRPGGLAVVCCLYLVFYHSYSISLSVDDNPGSTAAASAFDLGSVQFSSRVYFPGRPGGVINDGCAADVLHQSQCACACAFVYVYPKLIGTLLLLLREWDVLLWVEHVQTHAPSCILVLSTSYICRKPTHNTPPFMAQVLASA